MRYAINVILSVDAGARDTSAVRGRVESRYGRQSFSGWLDLRGQLEGLVDRAREDAGQRARDGAGGRQNPLSELRAAGVLGPDPLAAVDTDTVPTKPETTP